MLLAECDAGGVQRWQPCRVESVRVGAAGFELATTRGPIAATRLVVASGGLSIPKIGATDWGYVLARRLGHRIVEPRPALVPFLCDGPDWQRFAALAGVSLPVRIAAGHGARSGEFVDDLLFTHRGLSGPATLQASTYWRPGDELVVDLAPGLDLAHRLAGPRRAGVASARSWPCSCRGGSPKPGSILPRARKAGGRRRPVLRPWPGQAAIAWSPTCATATWRPSPPACTAGRPSPTGTEGYRKAEVTAGGVDTRDLDSRSCESRLVPGLHFIGEVVDVTGWLGGYNFQWAWASAAACARALAADCSTGRRGL